jgi:hypothetical protein
MAAIRPTKNTGLIVDEFLRYANEHLSTITGVIYTTSNYPPLGQPGPGIIQWQGYSVQGFKESTVIEEEIFQDVEIENAIIDEEFIEKGIPLDSSANGLALDDSIDVSDAADASFLGSDGELPELPELTDEEITNFIEEAGVTIEPELATTANEPASDNPSDQLNGPINAGGPMPEIIVDPTKLKQKFYVVTTRVIRELEGGYYHPQMLRDGRVKDSRYNTSGETMYGIDRKAGAPGTTNPPPAKQFWAAIDAAGAASKWKWCYIPPNPLRDKLVYLAAGIMEPQFKSNLSNYIGDRNLINLINSHDGLLYNFVYASWNGPGWFKGFARIIKAAYAGGMTNPTQLSRLFTAKRLNNVGVIGNKSNNSLIAQNGKKIAKNLGYA